MSVRILTGDCRAVMATLPECSVDAIVTDPPYELTPKNEDPRRASPDSAQRGRRGGFMGMAWDGTGVAFDPETWRQALRVLKPGGYLLAFGGTRTYHRMACAIEDAGFEIRDQIGWAFGSGFPKSHNGPWGGTALKPAWEPVCMARKPLIGTVKANWREHGTGALNIDGCRVPWADEADEADAKTKNAHADFGSGPRENKVYGKDARARGENGNYDAPGRWPANLIHDGSEEVLAAFPREAGAATRVRGTESSAASTGNVTRKRARVPGAFHGDTGSAARFFYCAKADRADRNEGLDGAPEKALNWSSGEQSPGTFQSPNTKRSAANYHPTVKPTDLMRYLCRLVTPPGGTVLDPFMGSGSTLKAAELEGFAAIGIELSPEYVAIAKRRIAADAPLLADVEASA